MSVAWVADHTCPEDGVAHRSEDCQQTKHDTCFGDAWCDAFDAPVECGCGCHEPELRR